MTDQEEEFKDPVVTGSPDYIWLNYGEIEEDCTHDEANTYENSVTWCDVKIDSADVKYVRADIHDAALQQSASDSSRSFQVLESLGIPKDRARTVHNGIMVLDLRYQREVQALRDRIKELEGQVPTKAMVDMLIRDICETDPYDADAKDAICIRYDDLIFIAERALLDEEVFEALHAEEVAHPNQSIGEQS